MLERHVNSHFSLPSETRQSGPRKSTETGDTARKRLKRAGVRLKFRQLPFSARIFDFFDAGNMAGIRHGVAELAARSGGAGVEGDGVRLQGTVLGSRLQGDGGGRWLNVRWSPPD
jgi:zinc finger protein AEBP2